MSASSGTYNFQLANADLILESFDRVEIRPSSITAEHMISARRSLNLELQRWANNGPLLWEIDLITIPLIQGVATYNIPPETVCLLDTYIRQFSLTGTYNVAVDFSTLINTTTITVTIANHGLIPGSWINITTPVAIAGQVLQGYYEVLTVVDTNNFTIASPVAAASTVNNGGVLPVFTAVIGQTPITVTLANHGLVAGQQFIIAAQTLVGGNYLSGTYTIASVVDSSNFIITTYVEAQYNDSVSENTNLVQVQYQQQQVQNTDFILTPFGRTDYAQIPDKTVQSRPTSYWFDRTINPSVTLWQVPDQNGPYTLNCYRMKRIQDANAVMGQIPDIPYRFIDALCAKLAYRLAMKYAKAMLPVLEKEMMAAYGEAQIEDRERADIFILPDLSSYYRD